MLRLAFLGSPAFAVPALNALLAAGHHVAAIYCQPPKPAHRGHAVTRCPVHTVGEALGIEVRTPTRLRHDTGEHARFRSLELDAAVVVAYGLLLPTAMLEAPRRGCLNIHASLLPRWRGAAPIQAALRAGDAQTGIAIMQMDAGLDTGAVLAQAALPIGPRDTTPMLHDRLSELGARLIVETLAAWPPAVTQPDAGVTYAAKLSRADAPLDWTQPAEVLDRQIRALTPWPGTTARLAGETLKILAATPADGQGAPGQILDAAFTVACGPPGSRPGGLCLQRVQRAGRPPTDGAAFLRGLPDWRGLRLT